MDEIRGWRGRCAVISQELLASAFPHHVERALNDLSFAEVHLVYTARDLARQIPAHWQEDVKNRCSLTFAEYVEGLRDPHRPGLSHWVREFWRMQDAPDVLARWGQGIPAERVHVVTLPRPGAPSGLLLERFSEVIGFDPSRCDTSGAFGNPSLGAAETEVIRRLNLATREDVEWQVHDDHVKHYLAQSVLTSREGAQRLRLPDAHRPWVVQRSREIVEALAGSGYRVVGDLDELVPDETGEAKGIDPDAVGEQEVMAAAVDAAAAMVRAWADAGAAPDGRGRDEVLDVKTVGALLRQLDEMHRDAAHLEEATTPAIKKVVRNLSERYPLVMRARERYWRLVEARREREPRATASEK
ncbi:hypothetical protein [Actinomadura rubrobrunea]|uniref:hypothetical protein n=1 Tax=Actinomadura rubrobrunea TaxID=115335 RepID=UPI0011B2314D|nr:hypothetical protein [Actinomadura rubrobrunea]